MKLYKHTFHDKKTGKKKQCKAWYISFTDNRQIRRQLPAFPSKKASERAAGKIEELLSSQGIISLDLTKWIKEIPVTMKNRLIKWDLIPKQKRHADKNLLANLTDFIDGMRAVERNEKYVRQTEQYIRVILDGCECETWNDIDGNEVSVYLSEMIKLKGLGQRTHNAYLVAMKSFTKWLLKNQRVTGTDPMFPVDKITQTEFLKVRRALTLPEQAMLLEATANAPKRFHMSGYERYLVYRLCIDTGMRGGEVASMKKNSMDFGSNTLRVDACDCKSKRTDYLPVPDTTAAAIKDFAQDKEPEELVFNMPHDTNWADMIKADLKVAGIPYTDEMGRDADFHSLRRTFCTNHAVHFGTKPAELMGLARHASIMTTMKYYVTLEYDRKAAAVLKGKSLTHTSTDEAIMRDNRRRPWTLKAS